MRKFCVFFLSLFICIDVCSAVVRAQNNSPRNSSENINIRQKTTTKKTNTSRTVATRTQKTPSLTKQDNNNSSHKTVSRGASNKTIVARGTKTKKSYTRTNSAPASRISRAATGMNQIADFGDNYNSCRDSYFSCMDQFCANQNETYRRCVCSSQLAKIQKQEKLLSQTATSLQSFEDLNIDVISKTANEVKAMGSATDGEAAIKKDTSESANTLKNISGVLNDTKKQSLSTAGKLDAGGDIKAIWSTTDLIGGSDIANLTGESLFNAVHSQCAELVTESCAGSDLKMVASAYGMYIENDCALLQNNLDSKTTSANSAIRTTRHKMQDARLENYNAHNSISLDDCIARVRNDITMDTACGDGYVHCLDFSGKYLNITTGETIYSPDFYQIENQISLSGDVLKNTQNSAFISMLNKKRSFAAKNLSLCSDNQEDVWNEFLRQALVEIYQGQQDRVKKVKEECLQVVNDCYLKQSEQLNKFSDTDTKMNLVQLLELSEEMCADKLNTCSNLYGGGNEGFALLVDTMTKITDVTIEQSCSDLLGTFAQKICAVSANDSSHSYPYGCRAYAPGEAHYAQEEVCNSTLVNPFSKTNILITRIKTQNNLSAFATFCSITSRKLYKSCKNGYYLYRYEACNELTNKYCYDNSMATECRQCPTTAICPGGNSEPVDLDKTLYDSCGEYYIGSLYQELTRYAIQNCTRTSNTSWKVSEALLSDINSVMKEVRAKLVVELSNECSNQSGIWVDIPWTDKNGDGVHDSTGDTLLNNFYVTTGANAQWGYCKQ